MCNTYTDTLTARRLEWIRTLESGTYRQGRGSLFLQSVNYGDDWDTEAPGEVVPGTQQFCCLGVARDVPTGGEWSSPIMDDESDMKADNLWVADYYGIPEKLRYYLMGMNDGDEVTLLDEPLRSGERYALVRAVAQLGSRIRYSHQKHDFLFIARFLRKVWGLTGA